MMSNGSSTGGLLTAGGVLSVVAGIPGIVGGGLLLAHVSASDQAWFNLMITASRWFLPFLPYGWADYLSWPMPGAPGLGDNPFWWSIIGGCITVLGIVAVVGGVSATKRKRFGLSLAGAVCGLISGVLGIVAVVFVSLSKREFEAKDRSGVLEGQA
jgi:hypothetical protein